MINVEAKIESVQARPLAKASVTHTGGGKTFLNICCIRNNRQNLPAGAKSPTV
ncbi:hypothetical protein [Paraburkholderia sp. ZP32-5]|uniref:hypothetical protein n=1 Tax=Paraburkholderia sp. ZP32-5 TaxID=2883245 RepID=UPI001F3B0295|nr:hypothetical protein [Paraburkholderia sp. ZP32-5]